MFSVDPFNLVAWKGVFLTVQKSPLCILYFIIYLHVVVFSIICFLTIKYNLECYPDLTRKEDKSIKW